MFATALKQEIKICVVYIVLVTIVKANLCENPENKELVSCWNGNYSSFNFDHVEVLHFTHNRVKSWWIFENLTITNQLFLDYNLLKDFNNVPESFHDLKELSLTHNEIKLIPKDSLINFRKLTTLRLCYNKITVIQADTFSRMIIKNLFISHNFIENLDFVNQLDRVQQLVLSSNRILNLDSIKDSLPKLKQLDLSGNFIADISKVSVLQFMTSVTEVNLTNNPDSKNSGELETELTVPLNPYKLVNIYVNNLPLRCNIEKLFSINQNDRLCWPQRRRMISKNNRLITAVSVSASVITLITIGLIYYVYKRRKNISENQEANLNLDNTKNSLLEEHNSLNNISSSNL